MVVRPIIIVIAVVSSFFSGLYLIHPDGMALLEEDPPIIFDPEDLDEDGWVEGVLEGDPLSVIICHVQGSPKTMDLDPGSVQDHVDHGDTIGPC